MAKRSPGKGRFLIGLCLSALMSAATAPPAGALKVGVSSPNVTYIKTIPLEAGTWTTARVLGHHLYVGGNKSFSIYDISDPLNPELLSLTPIGFQFVNEDLDTNGRILLLSDDKVRKMLHVWNVEDKGAPVKLAEIPADDHNFGCVLNCESAYGAGGTIIDLRDPSNPSIEGEWSGDPRPFFGFDTYEVSPGVVLTGSLVMNLLDGRRDPARPKVRARAGTLDMKILHSVRWPGRGKDPFILVQGETVPHPLCDDGAGAFMTWDATRWRKTHSFELIDEYRVTNGTYADGRPAANPFGCSAGWFQEHESFDGGGLVASGFFDHGTRFLRVDDSGQIEEVGYFMPLAGSTVAALWASRRVVYAIDIGHGIDILRYTGEL